jgi:hypothetical protein
MAAVITEFGGITVVVVIEIALLATMFTEVMLGLLPEIESAVVQILSRVKSDGKMIAR